MRKVVKGVGGLDHAEVSSPGGLRSVMKRRLMLHTPHLLMQHMLNPAGHPLPLLPACPSAVARV